MSDEEQEALYRHYGMIPRAKTGEHDRLRGDAAEVTLSEEKLDVGTRNVETGRVRLVRHAVTEQRNVKGDVRKERVDVERDDDRRGRR
jgi:stress response protein YsnF